MMLNGSDLQKSHSTGEGRQRGHQALVSDLNGCDLSDRSDGSRGFFSFNVGPNLGPRGEFVWDPTVEM